MGMDSTDWAAIVAIGDLVVNAGLPAAVKLIQTLDADQATLADIQTLKDQGLRPACEYFDEPSDG